MGIQRLVHCHRVTDDATMDAVRVPGGKPNSEIVSPITATAARRMA